MTSENGAETEDEEDEGNDEEWDRDRWTSRGAPVEVVYVGGDVPPPEENADLPYFSPERAHLLLQGFYGDFVHHNYGSHLDGGVADNAIYKPRCLQVDSQLGSWYAMPSGALGRRFTAILVAE